MQTHVAADDGQDVVEKETHATLKGYNLAGEVQTISDHFGTLFGKM